MSEHNFSFTVEQLHELLRSPVARFDKNRKLCKDCDDYDTVGHAGLKCSSCGGEPVSVRMWTMEQLFRRIKPFPMRAEAWLSRYVADYLHETTKAEWSACYTWARTNYKANVELLREYFNSDRHS